MATDPDEESWMTYGEPLMYPTYPEGYYERAEGSNYRNYGDDEGWPRVLDVLDRYYRSASLLEIGCAKGHFVKHARSRGYDARGFDISQYAIGRSVAPEHTYVWSAADPFPVETASLDIVASFEAFEHIYERDIPFMLREVCRVLLPGGQLVSKIGGLVPDDSDHDSTHFTKRPRTWWYEHMSAAGLRWTLADLTLEGELDEEFRGRDWAGRFIVASTY